VEEMSVLPARIMETAVAPDQKGKTVPDDNNNSINNQRPRRCWESDIMPPSDFTLYFRSTVKQRDNCDPIHVTVRLYRILQFAVFIFCRFTRTSSRPVDTAIQAIMPPITTLLFRSARNQRGNCGPILAAMRLYRILQLDVFDCCPFTRTSSRRVDAGIQAILPSI
jgi:hypothetical protein